MHTRGSDRYEIKQKMWMWMEVNLSTLKITSCTAISDRSVSLGELSSCLGKRWHWMINALYWFSLILEIILLWVQIPSGTLFCETLVISEGSFSVNTQLFFEQFMRECTSMYSLWVLHFLSFIADGENRQLAPEIKNYSTCCGQQVRESCFSCTTYIYQTRNHTQMSWTQLWSLRIVHLDAWRTRDPSCLANYLCEELRADIMNIKGLISFFQLWNMDCKSPGLSEVTNDEGKTWPSSKFIKPHSDSES